MYLRNMDSSVSPKDEIWFLCVCNHISIGLYNLKPVHHFVGSRIHTGFLTKQAVCHSLIKFQITDPCVYFTTTSFALVGSQSRSVGEMPSQEFSSCVCGINSKQWSDVRKSRGQAAWWYEVVALIWKYYELDVFRSKAPQIYRINCTLTLLSGSTYISGQLLEE